MQQRQRWQARRGALCAVMVMVAWVGFSVPAFAAPDGSISGRVLEGTGTGLAGICVNVEGGPGGVTDLNGDYSITGITAGSYRISYTDCNPVRQYLTQWFLGHADSATADMVSVADGADTPLSDVQLALGVSVAGHVTDTNGNPLPSISVNVMATQGGGGGWGQTDLNGDYRTDPVAPGDYRVQFSDPSPGPVWATQYWDQQPTWNSFTQLTLSDGDAPLRSGIDARLVAAATVTGTVTGVGGSPVQGICVNAFVDAPGGTDWVGGTQTASDGSYSIGGLPSPSAKVDFQDCNHVGPYIDQWWNGKTDYASADAVPLTPGGTATGVDAQLVLGSVITGTVTDGGGNPLGGICVQATTTTFVGGLTQTDQNGDYSILLSRVGDYRVQFVDCSSKAFAGQWWNNQTDTLAADVVHVGTGEVVGAIDAVLVPGAVGTISGRLANAHGVPMANACVVAFLPNQYALFAQVSPDGTYLLSDVPSGTYALAFAGCDSNNNPSATLTDPEAPATTYGAVWWQGAPLALDLTQGPPDPIAQGAHLVTVASGQDLTGYDWCFGCIELSVSAITPGVESLTVEFGSSGTADVGTLQTAAVSGLTYTVSCTSITGGTAGSASAGASPITVSGLTQGATYTCQVTASDGQSVVGSSALSQPVVVLSASLTATALAPAGDVAATALPAALARTGAEGVVPMVAFGIASIGLGLVMLVLARRAVANSTQ